MFRLCLLSSCMFFFFKQKTAYEMRISDWSSDVCSSDLACPSMAGAPNEQIPAIRECEAQAFYVSNAYRRLQTLFDVSIEDQMIGGVRRSEEHTSELQSLMRTSYAVFCLKKKTLILVVGYAIAASSIASKIRVLMVTVCHSQLATHS